MGVLFYPYALARPGHSRRPNLALLVLVVGLFLVGGSTLGALLEESELPECDSPEVVAVVDRVVREAVGGVAVGPIDGHREVDYDGDEDVRQGECVLHAGGVDVPVKYQVRWRDFDRGEFEVRLAP